MKEILFENNERENNNLSVKDIYNVNQTEINTVKVCNICNNLSNDYGKGGKGCGKGGKGCGKGGKGCGKGGKSFGMVRKGCGKGGKGCGRGGKGCSEDRNYCNNCNFFVSNCLCKLFPYKLYEKGCYKIWD